MLDPCAKILLRVRLAKDKMYEAKVGKLEWQKKWDKPGIGELLDLIDRLLVLMVFGLTGTSEQPRYKSIMEKRDKALLQKFNTFKSNVENYHLLYPDRPGIQLPTFDEIKKLDINDPFWNIGNLTHPEEPWAADLSTQAGIQAFRTARSGEEEVERIAYEVQNMVRSALLMEEKHSALWELSEMRKLI